MTDIKSLLLTADLQRVFNRLILLLAAAVLVWNILVSWKVFFPEPLKEAASRSLLASNSSLFYGSGPAEPLPVAALKAVMPSGIHPGTLVRAEGLLLFAVIFVLTVFVLRKRFGEAAAAVAALFLAANPYMGYFAMQGASHLFALAFLLLFWHYFDSREGGRRGALLAGLFGGLACLSRLDAAWFLLVIAALTWAVRRKEFRLKEAGLSLGLAFLLLAPYLAYQKRVYGNSLYAQELSLRRWANIDRYAYDPSVQRPQGPLGAGAFLLRDGPAGAVRDLFGGLGRSLAYEVPKILYYKFFMVLVFLGVYAAFARRHDRALFFLAAALLPALPLAAIEQIPATGGIELKYYLWTLWAMCALGGLGFQETLEWVEDYAKKWADSKLRAALKK